MKIKCDFVTNSSSTGFILKNTITGVLTVSNDISVGDVAKVFDDNNQGYYYEDCVSITKGDDVFDEEYFNIYMKLVEFFVGDSENTDIKVLLTIVENFSDNVNSSKPLDRMKQTLEVLIGQSGIKVEDSKLMMTQNVVDFWGDGWDGGDPMGQYKNSHECMAHETLTGIVTIKNGKVDIKVEEPFRKFWEDKLSWIK